MHRAAVEQIISLIEHLRIEAVFGSNPEGCFYCGQDHRSTRCFAPERSAFLDFLSECAALDWDAWEEPVTELLLLE